MKQLGLVGGLPRNPVPDLRFLTFQSWWTEMGTKRYMELSSTVAGLADAVR